MEWSSTQGAILRLMVRQEELSRGRAVLERRRDEAAGAAREAARQQQARIEDEFARAVVDIDAELDTIAAMLDGRIQIEEES